MSEDVIGELGLPAAQQILEIEALQLIAVYLTQIHVHQSEALLQQADAALLVSDPRERKPMSTLYLDAP